MMEIINDFARDAATVASALIALFAFIGIAAPLAVLFLKQDDLANAGVKLGN